MKKFTLPKIGLRNLKTALSVVLCILIINFLNMDNPFFACISAVICMKDTIPGTWTMAIDRFLGTLIGGLIGLVFLFTLQYLPSLNHPNAIIIGIGVIICIYICTLIEKPGAVTICCIVFISILINYSGSESYHYAIQRTFETFIGVAVAILVNKFISPPKE